MDVISAIQGRRSIRQYSPQPIDNEKVNKVLEAARLAPSAGNRQSWKFVVVKDYQTRRQLAEAAGGQSSLAQAPIVIVACGTETEGVMLCGQYRYTVDLSIATAFMILEAHEQGLGTCWLGSFDEKRVREILEIPDPVRIVAMTPLGVPAERPDPKSRKELADIVSYERYK